MFLIIIIISIIILITAILFELAGGEDQRNFCLCAELVVLAVLTVFVLVNGVFNVVNDETKTVEVTEYKFVDDRLVFKIDDNGFTVDNDDVVYVVASNKTGLYVKYSKKTVFDKICSWGLDRLFGSDTNYKNIKVYYHTDIT